MAEIHKLPVEKSDLEWFEEFKLHYPRKQAWGGKYGGRETFLKHAKLVGGETIVNGLIKNLCAFSPERQYQPLPATWLNREQWDDEPVEAPKPTYQPPKDNVTVRSGAWWRK